MKVLLISRKFSLSGSGVYHYSFFLKRNLEKLGVKVATISQDSYLNRIGIYFYDSFYLPLRIILKKSKFAVLHALAENQAFYLPFVSQRTVVTFHDLMRIIFPQKGISKVYNLVYKVATRCKRIIANSSQTKNELIKFLRVPEEKIRVIPLGVNEGFFPRRKITRDGFTVGFVGTITNRKGIPFFLNVANILIKKYPRIKWKFVLCGRVVDYNLFLLLQYYARKFRKKLFYKSFINQKDLPTVFNSFDAFLFPSIYEGFGLPILEANACGIPVIIRKIAKIPSEVTLASLKVSSAEEAADVLYTLASDKKFYSKTRKEGIKHASNFSWIKTAKKTIEVYEELI